MTTLTIDHEEWKPISGYSGYEISSHGRIRSFIPSTKRKEIPHILATTRHYKNGYVQIRLGRDKVYFVLHRLVAKAFIPNPDNKRCVNHLDSNRCNNHVSNLEWCSHRENALHSYDFNNRASPRRKLLNDSILEISKSQNVAAKVLAQKFNCNIRTIHKIWSGERHTRITGITPRY